MTRAQEMETKRFTQSMWTMLRYAKKMHPFTAEVGGPFMRTATILERRGFLTMARKRKGCNIALTEAGHEALAGARSGLGGREGRDPPL
jgi:hypothetical protein